MARKKTPLDQYTGYGFNEAIMQKFIQNLLRGAQRRKLSQQLRHMSKHQLEDIGITRGDIPAICRTAW